MWGFFATIVVCATVVWFAKNYLEPYHRPEKPDGISDYDYKQDDAVVFDDVIKEIYGRLDEDE